MSRIVPISYTDEDGNYHEHTGILAWIVALFVTCLIVGAVAFVLLVVVVALLSPILVPLGLGFLIGKIF